MLTPIAAVHPQAGQFLEKRKQDRKRILSENIVLTNKRVVWFHAASVGELDQCKAIAEEGKKREGNLYTLFSVFSDSVSDKQLQDSMIDFAFRLPLDFPGEYDFIFEKFRPESLVISAWDLWLNMILSAHKNNAKIYLVNATLSSSSGRMNPIAKRLTQITVSKMSGLAPVSEESEIQFRSILGNTNIPILRLGDSRFDSVSAKIEKNLEKNDPLKGYEKNRNVIILASTYSACEEMIFPVLKELLSRGRKIWIFSHKVHPERIQNIAERLNGLSLKFSRFSEEGIKALDSEIAVFDVLGVLAFAYSKAGFAYVGGALHNRVHNVIEPAYFGLPVLAGPKIFNSAEAQELRKRGGLWTVNTAAEFLEKEKYLSDGAHYRLAEKTNSDFVTENRGASERIWKTFLNRQESE